MLINKESQAVDTYQKTHIGYPVTYFWMYIFLFWSVFFSPISIRILKWKLQIKLTFYTKKSFESYFRIKQNHSTHFLKKQMVHCFHLFSENFPESDLNGMCM